MNSTSANARKKTTALQGLRQDLHDCLDKLDTLGAQIPAAHLDACLHALDDTFIVEESTSKRG